MNLKNKTLYAVLRTLLGLMLVVFGLNGFLEFMPMEEPTGAAGVLMGALFGTSYMLYMIKGLEIVVGLMLLTNKYVPLAGILLAPLSINFVAFHAFLMPQGIAGALVVLILNIYLGHYHWKTYKPLLKA